MQVKLNLKPNATFTVMSVMAAVSATSRP